MSHKIPPEGWLSVTEVISYGLPKVKFSKSGSPYFFLEQWRGNVGNPKANEVTTYGKNVGTTVHKLIEERFNGSSVMDGTRETRMCMNFFKAFVEPYAVEPILLEPEDPFRDEELKVQGTPDGLFHSNRGDFIGDYKTSNSLDDLTLGLQLAAYAKMSNSGIWQGCGIRIDKVKDIVEDIWYPDEKVGRPDLTYYWEAFKRVNQVARLARFGIAELLNENKEK